MRISSADVKAHFPNVEAGFSPGGYCVLGAVAKLIEKLGLTSSMPMLPLYAWDILFGHSQPRPWAPVRFPQMAHAKVTLQALNPSLSEALAGYFAARVISKNDSLKFDEAWSILDEALTYPPPEAEVQPTS